MTKKEVEIKVSVDEEQAQKLIDDYQGEAILEVDKYFDHPVRDALSNNECIRIRERGGSPLEFTYKPPSSSEMAKDDQFWKEEVDIEINNMDMKERLERLLRALGCEELVDVVKKRRKFTIRDRTVTLDKIEGAGFFVEVETITSEDPQEAVKGNREVLTELGIESYETVNMPYRDIVLENQ